MTGIAGPWPILLEAGWPSGETCWCPACCSSSEGHSSDSAASLCTINARHLRRACMKQQSCRSGVSSAYPRGVWWPVASRRGPCSKGGPIWGPYRSGCSVIWGTRVWPLWHASGWIWRSGPVQDRSGSAHRSFTLICELRGQVVCAESCSRSSPVMISHRLWLSVRFSS